MEEPVDQGFDAPLQERLLCELLAHTDQACPRCGYLLRGLRRQAGSDEIASFPQGWSRPGYRLCVRGGQPREGAPPVRLLARCPWLRRLPARLVGIGVRPEHVRTPAVQR